MLFGLVTGLMYLEQARRLKRRAPAAARGLQLAQPRMAAPGQQSGDRRVADSDGRGRLSGLVLTSLSHDGRIALERSGRARARWACSSGCWSAAVVNLLYKPARAGRKVAYLTLVSFVFLVVVLGVGLWLDTAHGGSRKSSRDSGADETASRWRNAVPATTRNEESTADEEDHDEAPGSRL